MSKLKNKVLDNFFLINSDSIIDINLNSFQLFHQRKKNDITIAAASKSYDVPYGTCKIDSEGNLKSITEKPNFKFTVNTGLYLINRNVIQFIPKNKKMDMDKLISLLIKNGKKVKIFPIADKNWNDVGEWNKYEKFRKKNKS